jgi:hypothetical protein
MNTSCRFTYSATPSISIWLEPSSIKPLPDIDDTEVPLVTDTEILIRRVQHLSDYKLGVESARNVVMALQDTSDQKTLSRIQDQIYAEMEAIASIRVDSDTES